MPVVAYLGEDGSIVRPGVDAMKDIHHGVPSLVEGLPGWGVTLVTLGAIGAVILAGIYLTRPVFRFIHSARLREMSTTLALMIVVGISFLMTLVEWVCTGLNLHRVRTIQKKKFFFFFF